MKSHFDHAPFIRKSALVGKLAHQKNSAAIGLFQILGSCGVRNMFKIESGTLIRDFKKEVGLTQFVLHENKLVFIQSIAMNNGVVDGLCHGDEDIPVALLLKGLTVSNFIN